MVPVAGALHYPQFCSSRWTDAAKTCAAVSSSAETCSSVEVPADLIKGIMVCKDSPSTGCGTSTPNGAGIAGADLLLLVTAVEGGSCGGATQAYATSCATDEFDRPIVGRVNFCRSALDDKSDDAKSKAVGTTMHELAHVLGFSSNSFRKFRDSNGAARSPEKSTQYTCGGSTRSTYGLVNTVASFPERGAATCGVDPIWVESGTKCVFKMVTPAVLRRSRDFFDCETLNGLELENQPTSGACTMIGSHWEQVRARRA